MMPYNEDIERHVIKVLLSDSQACEEYISSIDQSYFYKTNYQAIYLCIAELVAENGPVDILTVNEKVEKNKLVDAVGGIQTLLTLCDEWTSSANIKYHLNTLKTLALRRKVIEICNDVTAKAGDNNTPVSDIISGLSEKLYEINLQKANTGLRQVSDDIHKTYVEIIERNAGERPPRGLKTGFSALDYELGGLQPGQLIVVSGKTSHGKTAFVTNIAQEINRNGIAVAHFSLEMNYEEVKKRMLQAESRVNLKKSEIKGLSKEEQYQILKASERISEYKQYWIDDTGGISLQEIESKLIKAKRDNNIGLAVVDYLQYVTAKNKNINSREQEVSTVSRGLKSIAMNLEIPIIAVSSLSRKTEENKGMPTLAMLRDSGNVEYDANAVLMVYNRFMDFPEFKEYATNVREIGLLKNREGALNTLYLQWHGEQTRFVTIGANQ
jgi:replicative DNA helicase